MSKRGERYVDVRQDVSLICDCKSIWTELVSWNIYNINMCIRFAAVNVYKIK